MLAECTVGLLAFLFQVAHLLFGAVQGLADGLDQVLHGLFPLQQIALGMNLEGLEIFLCQLEEFRAVVLEGRAGQGIEVVA